MAILTPVQTTEFDAMVKAAYQSSGRLLENTTRMRPNVIGGFVQWPKMGSIEAQKSGYTTQVVGQNPNYAKVTSTLQKYMASSYVDTIEELTNNFSARAEQAKITGMALGRREDQIKLEALINSGTTNTIADGGTSLTYDKLTEITEMFDDKAVPIANRHIVISAKASRDLLKIQQFTDNQYIDKGAVRRGSVDGSSALSMNFHLIPSMTNTTADDGTSGGLPKTANIRSLFAWDSDAVGYAYGKITSEINYIAEKTSWLINGLIFADASAVDARGIVKIDIDESK